MLPSSSDLILPLVLASLLFFFFSFIRRSLTNTKATKLTGPPNPSLLFGALRVLVKSDDQGALHEQWATRYGPAFRVAGPLGSSRIIICDPRAIAHFYAKETFAYVQTRFAKVFIGNLFGRGLLYAEGESHRRQRKALSPAFSNAAIRKLTHVFYDAAYKLKAHWDSTLSAASGEAMIDVQACLDSIGIAGFGHDFQALDGVKTPIIDVFESFSNSSNSLFGRIVFLLSPVFPWLQHLPTKQNRTIKRMRATMGEIADEVLKRNRSELTGSPLHRRISPLLAKAEMSSTSLGMSRAEVLSQNVLLIAGTYDIWALIELCRRPEKQQKLRQELAQLLSEGSDPDPSFDQLSTGLPYLDAVTLEVLRLHPPVAATTRVATEDDVIPFSAPIKTSSGEEVSSLVIKKGETITAPILYMNRAEMFWGPNATQFEPDGGWNLKARAVLSVLIRNYTFELPNGPTTKIESHPAIFRRPKVAGEVEPRLPLRIRRVE
ncbi:cytochrome P450 [Gymnopilus junonius]|uniref:Cytochrome P450 n=1 Tax=Gymnopilus junonius TaxID=109634 RepID=A0A9P5NC08_GYMJU|nr:cytochrome P450 [Gymnopilus junonius]